MREIKWFLCGVLIIIFSFFSCTVYAMSMDDVMNASSRNLKDSVPYLRVYLTSPSGEATVYISKKAYFRNKNDKYYNVYVNYTDRTDVYLEKYKVVKNKTVKLMTRSRVTVDTLQTIATEDYSVTFNGLYNEIGLEISPKNNYLAKMIIEVAQNEDRPKKMEEYLMPGTFPVKKSSIELWATNYE